MLRFYKLLFQFLLMASLAFIVWEMQDFVASFAATELTTTTTLRTTEERDDARVLRAFKSAKESQRVTAELTTEPNTQQQTRDATLTLSAKTKNEVLANRESLVKAMQAAFAHDGPGELFDIGNAPHAVPMPNQSMAMIKQAFRSTSLALLLGGLAMLLLQWKRSHLPKAALFGILATTLTTVGVAWGDDYAGVMGPLLIAGLPIAFLVLIGYVTQRVKRAATWQESRARITQSKVDVERHRFAGDTTKVKNTAFVAYDFKANGQTIHGDRISIGIAPADNVDQVLKRYPVGAEVTVFYDPENPKDCVLERHPPVSLGCLWTGTIAVVLLYALAVAFCVSGKSLDTSAGSLLPQVHHPIVVIITGLLGMLSLAAGTYFHLHPRKAFPWLRTDGSIVSSNVESYTSADSPSNSSQRRYYKAVIEFSYNVEGHEYHNTVGGSNPITISISGNQSNAEAEVAKYPAGKIVDVYYDPQNPTRSSLENNEMVLDGRRSLIMGVIFIAIAIYAALS